LSAARSAQSKLLKRCCLQQKKDNIIERND